MDPLTDREEAIRRQVARDLGNQEIANVLAVCEPTVCFHTSEILGEPHLASRAQASLHILFEGMPTFLKETGQQAHHNEPS